MNLRERAGSSPVFSIDVLREGFARMKETAFSEPSVIVMHPLDYLAYRRLQRYQALFHDQALLLTFAACFKAGRGNRPLSKRTEQRRIIKAFDAYCRERAESEVSA